MLTHDRQPMSLPQMTTQEGGDGAPFEAKMKRFVAELCKQQVEGARLDAAIATNLKALGFGYGRS